MLRDSEEKRDWRVAATLLAVWFIALLVVTGSRIEIPLSMLGMATVFFILLIPAMHDLVRSIERTVLPRPGNAERGGDSTQRQG
jgi:hypothetical protein